MRKSRKDIPYVSAGLVIINVVLFFATYRSQYMLWGKGLLGVSEVWDGKEYGRLFSSIFLHADLEHLFNNMLILFFLGAMLEKEIGHLLFLGVYMFAGLTGNVASMLWQVFSGDYYYSLGASGAVFGLDGLLLAIVMFAGSRFPEITAQRVLIMLLLSIYNGMRSGSIDNAAHAGGFLGGFLAGIVVCFILYRKDRRTTSEY